MINLHIQAGPNNGIDRSARVGSDLVPASAARAPGAIGYTYLKKIFTLRDPIPSTNRVPFVPHPARFVILTGVPSRM